MNTLAQEAEAFELAVMPTGAGPVQRQEMVRSFYAGCNCLLNLLHEVAGLPEEEGVAVLNSYRDEIEEFVRKIQRGEA